MPPPPPPPGPPRPPRQEALATPLETLPGRDWRPEAPDAPERRRQAGLSRGPGRSASCPGSHRLTLPTSPSLWGLPALGGPVLTPCSGPTVSWDTDCPHLCHLHPQAHRWSQLPIQVLAALPRVWPPRPCTPGGVPPQPLDSAGEQVILRVRRRGSGRGAPSPEA